MYLKLNAGINTVLNIKHTFSRVCKWAQGRKLKKLYGEGVIVNLLINT